LCRDRNRRIERIDAIAYHSGPLQEKIQSYKYDGKVGWSLIFGRLVVGWLEALAGHAGVRALVLARAPWR